MIVVTGGAGFIGSNIVRGLNGRGEDNILVVDGVGGGEKVTNLNDCRFADMIPKQEFRRRLNKGEDFGGPAAIFHQGACSDTMVTDGDYVMDNNYRYSAELLTYCQAKHIPLIYASSASVYGTGEDFKELPGNERPINSYAFSKWLFDNLLRKSLDHNTSQLVGLRYFNVYGPREVHKGRMASVVFHFYGQLQRLGRVRLFGAKDGYEAGNQQRDFVSVDDVISVNLYFFDHPDRSGIYNLGSGHARTYNDMALAVINAIRERERKPALQLREALKEGLIEYIPFPTALIGKYQSYTCADISALRNAGWNLATTDLETGVRNYVNLLGEQVCEDSALR